MWYLNENGGVRWCACRLQAHHCTPGNPTHWSILRVDWWSVRPMRQGWFWPSACLSPLFPRFAACQELSCQVKAKKSPLRLWLFVFHFKSNVKMVKVQHLLLVPRLRKNKWEDDFFNNILRVKGQICSILTVIYHEMNMTCCGNIFLVICKVNMVPKAVCNLLFF